MVFVKNVHLVLDVMLMDFVDFVLVGGIKDISETKDALEQAALVRNVRRAITTGEAMTDFVLVGLAEEGEDHRLALVPELQNHRRVLLQGEQPGRGGWHTVDLENATHLHRSSHTL